MNIKNLTLILLSIFALQACDNSDAYFGGGGVDDDDDLPVFNRLADLVKFENVPTDSLSFNPTEDSEVEGSFGVKIHLPAGSVAGTLVDTTQIEELFVVLREYPTITKMGVGNVQTVSDQELLVTGGNFWWQVVDSAGNAYELASNNSVWAEQPIVLDMGEYTSQANYYKGEVVSAGDQEVLNWTLQADNENQMNNETSIFTYYGIDLGWVNCDALYNYSEDRTQFRVLLNAEADLQPTEQMVLFVPNEFPSLVNITTREDDYFVTYDDSIPVGISGTLIGLALDIEGNIMVGSLPITVAGDDEFQIDLVEGTMTQFTNLLNQASN